MDWWVRRFYDIIHPNHIYICVFFARAVLVRDLRPLALNPCIIYIYIQIYYIIIYIHSYIHIYIWYIYLYNYIIRFYKPPSLASGVFEARQVWFRWSPRVAFCFHRDIRDGDPSKRTASMILDNKNMLKWELKGKVYENMAIRCNQDNQCSMVSGNVVHPWHVLYKIQQIS